LPKPSQQEEGKKEAFGEKCQKGKLLEKKKE